MEKGNHPKRGSKLKSLGLSGARKAGREAMRKLFGRESSAINGGSHDGKAAAEVDQKSEPLQTKTHTGHSGDSGPSVTVPATSTATTSVNALNAGPNALGEATPPAVISDSHLDSDAPGTLPNQPEHQHQPQDQHQNHPISSSLLTDNNSTGEPLTSVSNSPPTTTADPAMRALKLQELQQQRLPSKPADATQRPEDAAPGKENHAPITTPTAVTMPAPVPTAASAPQPTADVDDVTNGIRDVSLIGESQLLSNERPSTPEAVPELDEATKAEQAKHLAFMEEALEMARLALRTNETPVGCVLVHNDKVIARGMNATNVTRNGTRHAEFMALSALISISAKRGPRTTSLKPRIEYSQDEIDDDESIASRQPDEGNEDGRKSHLYPYGQKEHPDDIVHPSIIRECILYVTVEPCIMCASLLRQMGIKKVYFGAVNDKFGGTGGVFSIHANSEAIAEDGQTASAHPQIPPTRLPGGAPVLGLSFPPRGGDGGNVEPGFEIEGGWGRDDAVALLRRFYVQENERAPVPRKKEGRAARLAAMMQEDGASETGEFGGASTSADGQDAVSRSASEAGDSRRFSSEDDEPSSLHRDKKADEDGDEDEGEGDTIIR